MNPTHRFWAHQANAAYPMVPAGVLCGGPDLALEDAYVQGIGLVGSPAQKCYVDNFQSPSTNEVAINWNSSLAWVVAFIDEKFDK
jgi:endoglucanase